MNEAMVPDHSHGDRPGGRLAWNIMHFARLLRAAGLPIGSGQILEALAATELGCLGSREDFYWALHSVFVTRHDQTALFDEAFRAFWRQPKALEQLMLQIMQQRALPAGPPRPKPGQRRLDEAMFDAEQHREDRRSPPEIELEATFSVSTREVLKTKDFEQMSAAEMVEARRAIAAMRLRRIAVPTRRYQPFHAGSRVDMRRTMRAALRNAGMVDIAWRKRRRRVPPLVVLCDISGSMSGYTRMFLHFLHALVSDGDRVHIFLFGTRLTNVTRQLQRRDVDEALAAVGEEVTDWDGGTRIGASLKAFNYHWARRVLGQGAHVLLITDGLERDDPDLLAHEMQRLRRVAKRVTWLNPLLRFDRFEARAGGIRTMLEHVDAFRPIHNLESLEDLATALSYSNSDNGRDDPRLWLAAADAA